MSLILQLYLNYVFVLTISSRAAIAQFDFDRSFYSIPRNIVSKFNNFRQDHYPNGIGSYVQLSTIKFSYSADYKVVGDECYTKDFTGLCKLTSKCPEIVRDIQHGKNPTVCSYQPTEAVVCCPKQFVQPDQTAFNNYQYYRLDSSTNQNLIYPTLQPNRKVVHQRQSGERRSLQKCEEYSKLATRSSSFISLSITASTQKITIPTCTYATGLIVGGEIAKRGEFPHMAAVGWSNNGEKDWICGGSLISEFFVLTAGHCASFYGTPPDIVRLGGQNLVSDDNGQLQEYQIENVIPHPNYRHYSNYHDIALLKLSRQAMFTRFVRPACLWQNNILNSTKAVATGWGRVGVDADGSKDLKKVTLNIVDNNHCQQLYETSKRLRNGIVRSQLCAGHLEGGKDTCHGDSGGPIQVTKPGNQCIFHIIGITSFGKACAAVNTAGVYTRVSSYLDWIEAIVWP